MKNKYYNLEEFIQIKDLFRLNPYSALIKAERYLEKYPKDYSAYMEYAKMLCVVEKFDEAERVLKYIESCKERWSQISSVKTKIMFENIVHVKIKILAGREEYERLYNYYYDNKDYIQSMDYNNILFYCKKKLGMIESDPAVHKSYLFKQIAGYDEVEFFLHINRHLPDNPNPSTSIFTKDFKLLKAIEEIRKIIPTTNRLFNGFYDDTYIFRYDDCGYDSGKKVNYFKVVCFHNTKDIITMCPSSGCENLPSINLNHIAYSDEKKESRIDKFNKKYGLK